MPITSALPGLWAGCVAATALAGATFYQQPAPVTDVAPPSVSRTGPIITTLFGKGGATGHLTLRLAYRFTGDAKPVTPLAALAANRLTQAALTRGVEFDTALDDERAFQRFVIDIVGTVEGYTIDAVEEASFHPFSSSE